MNAGRESMLIRRRDPDVDRRQQREYIRLNNGHENMEADERNGYERGKNSQSHAKRRRFLPAPGHRRHQQAEENHVQQVAGKNIGPQADRQGEDASRGADELDRKQKNPQQPVSKGLRRTRESQQVTMRLVVYDPLPVE